MTSAETTETDTVTAVLTRTQVTRWLETWEHLPEGDDAELAELYRLVDNAPGTRGGRRITLTRAQACDLLTYCGYGSEGRDMSDHADRGYAVALLAAAKRLTDAGAETIEQFNRRTDAAAGFVERENAPSAE